MTDAVRPTLRALDDLALVLPDLGVDLSRMPHPVVERAQQVPHGRTERIVSITDRVVLKVKTSNQRGAVVDLRTERSETRALYDQHWWLVAAGSRADDSPQRDFYAQLAASCSVGTQCDSSHLLPTPRDEARLHAEASVLAERKTRQVVRWASARALTTGGVPAFSLGERDVRIRVRVFDDGRAYLAIGATGTADPRFLFLVLASVPGIAASEWMPEPGGVADLEPAPGEILWSTILSPETQARVIDEFADIDGPEFNE